jgi:hypothetical protein
MSGWIKFHEKVPAGTNNFGWKIMGQVRNDWLDTCEPNEWHYISEVAPVVPGGDGNHVIFIFDSMVGP